MRQTLFQSLLLLILAAPMAFATSNPPLTFEQFKEMVSKEDPEIKFAVVPYTKLIMMEDKDGVFFVSSNGRFQFLDGALYDNWYKRKITGVDQLKAAQLVPMEKLGFDVDALATFKLSNFDEKYDLALFVDPFCERCPDALTRLEEVKDEFNVAIILLPVLKKESADVAKQLWCKEDKEDVISRLIEQRYDDLPEPGEECDIEPFKTTISYASVMEIKALPFVHKPDGTTLYGLPSEAGKWLRGEVDVQ